MYKPAFPYLGDQIIINSGRVVLNSKDDSILLFAKESIGIMSNGTVHFNSNDDIIMNAPRIYLGLDTATTTPEPIVKGDQLVKLLTQLIDALNVLAEKNLETVDSNGVAITNLTTACDSLRNDLGRITNQLGNINSTYNYTI